MKRLLLIIFTLTLFIMPIENIYAETESNNQLMATSQEEAMTCKEIVGVSVINVLKLAWIAIKIAAPLVVIVMSMLDFTKAVGINDSNYILKALMTLTKRGIILACLFLVPTVVKVIANVASFDTTCIFF